MALRFGLLGTGYWAAETQAPALAAHPEVEFAAVWGRDPAKAAALADRYGARPYRDVDALLADVDAVAVALPPDVQAEVALRAARMGRHLLLDKPLAFTTGAADRLVDEADRHGVASVVFFTNRFCANVEEFLARLGEGDGWDGARGTMFASIFRPGNPYGGSPWRREKGGLWDIGPHALSVILPVLGPVRQVVAAGGPHDTVYAILSHAGGATSTLALTLDAPSTATAFEFVFYGSGGFASVPACDRSAVDAFADAASALIRAAGGGDRHPCDLRFGREVVAILAAADQARLSGSAVRLDG
jgi:predicted dehydrogenase